MFFRIGEERIFFGRILQMTFESPSQSEALQSKKTGKMKDEQ